MKLLLYPKNWSKKKLYLVFILLAFIIAIYYTQLSLDSDLLRVLAGILSIYGIIGLLYEFIKKFKNKKPEENKYTSENTVKKDEVEGKNIKFNISLFKPNKFFYYGLISAFGLLLIIYLIINSNFYIKYNFEKAFSYFMTGDCETFLNYIDPIQNDDNYWSNICIKEKNETNDQLKEIKDIIISNKFLSKDAFLQANFVTIYFYKEKNNLVKYQLKRDGLKWKISQNNIGLN